MLVPSSLIAAIPHTGNTVNPSMACKLPHQKLITDRSWPHGRGEWTGWQPPSNSI